MIGNRRNKNTYESVDVCRDVALAEAVTKVKFLKELINIFDLKLSNPVKIYEDNIGAINIANYGTLQRTQNILKYIIILFTNV